jgi:hypothetical protein
MEVLDDVSDLQNKEVFIGDDRFILNTDKLSLSNILQTNNIISGDANLFRKYVYPLFHYKGNINDIKIESIDDLIECQKQYNKYEIELSDDELEMLYERVYFSHIVEKVRDLVFKKSFLQYLLVGIPRWIKNYKNKKLKNMLMEYIKKNLKDNNLDYDNFNYQTIKNYINQNNILRLIKLNKYSCVVLVLFKFVEEVYNVKLEETPNDALNKYIKQHILK